MAYDIHCSFCDDISLARSVNKEGQEGWYSTVYLHINLVYMSPFDVLNRSGDGIRGRVTEMAVECSMHSYKVGSGT